MNTRSSGSDQRFLEAFKCRICLYPTEPILIRPEQRIDIVRI